MALVLVPPQIAIHKESGLVVRGGTGSVYAETDPVFTTPLQAKRADGTNAPSPNSGPQGLIPAFWVDIPEDHAGVFWKAGDTTIWLATREGYRGPKGEKGDIGNEGPYGGTQVTDPQVASFVADSARETRAAVKDAAAEVAKDALNPAGKPVAFEQFPIAASGVEQFNSAAIAQDTITTAPNGDIYAVYWDANREPRLAVKANTSEVWATVSLAGIRGNPLRSPVMVDSHNNIVVAVDGAGYIHISGNHHAHRLRYIRSAAPYDVNNWVVPTTETPSLMIGADEDRVTYPQFVRLADGDLFFTYRNGESGNGDQFINRWDTTTRTWSRVCQLFKGTAPVSPDQSAYISRVCRDKTTGRLHIFYMWREVGEPPINTDLSYIYSDDDGVTWRNIAGTAQTLPIQPGNTATIVIAGDPGKLTNQAGACVDSNGRPHTLNWIGPASGSRELWHTYWDGSAWQTRAIADEGLYISRPTAYATDDGKVYALYKSNARPHAQRCYPDIGEPVLLFNHNQSSWEPSYDAHAPANVLRMMVAPSNKALSTFSSTYAGVLSVDMGEVDALPESLVVARPESAPVVPPITATASVAGGSPMVSGRFYAPSGPRVTTGTAQMASGEFRGVFFTPGKSGTITSLSVQIQDVLGSTSTCTFQVFTIDGEYINGSAPFDTATSGIKTASVFVPVNAAQTYVVGVLNEGGLSPRFTWIEGTHDGRLGSGSAASAFSNTLAGVGTSGLSRPLPATIAINGTARAPLVVAGIQ